MIYLLGFVVKNDLLAKVISINLDFKYFCYLAILSCGLLACNEKTSSTKEENKEDESAELVLHTDLGDIGIVLFEETPTHRANFLKLAYTGFFDSLSFHRIIRGFMIQSGDPRFKNGAFDRSKPSGPAYELRPEFSEHLAHTRGMIGAAREPDEENPEMLSSGSQFYIVTGKAVTAVLLDSIASMVGNPFKKGLYYQKFQDQKSSGNFNGSFDQFLSQNNYKPFSYTPAQKSKYILEGGSPHLDFRYTIFGKVVFGLDVVMEISKIPTDVNDIPKDTIRILSVDIEPEVLRQMSLPEEPSVSQDTSMQ